MLYALQIFLLPQRGDTKPRKPYTPVIINWHSEVLNQVYIKINIIDFGCFHQKMSSGDVILFL